MLSLSNLTNYPDRALKAYVLYRNGELFPLHTRFANNPIFLKIYNSHHWNKEIDDDIMSIEEKCALQYYNTTGDSSALALLINRDHIDKYKDMIDMNFSKNYQYPRLDEILASNIKQFVFYRVSYPEVLTDLIVIMWMRNNRIFLKNTELADILGLLRISPDPLYMQVNNLINQKLFDKAYDIISNNKINPGLIHFLNINDEKILTLLFNKMKPFNYRVFKEILTSNYDLPILKYEKHFPDTWELTKYDHYNEQFLKMNPSILLAQMVDEIVTILLKYRKGNHISNLLEVINVLHSDLLTRKHMVAYIKEWYMNSVIYNCTHSLDIISMDGMNYGKDVSMYLSGDISSLVAPIERSEIYLSVIYAARSGNVELLKVAMKRYKNPNLMHLIYLSAIQANSSSTSKYLADSFPNIIINHTQSVIEYAMTPDSQYEKFVKFDKFIIERIFAVKGLDTDYTILMELLARDISNSYNIMMYVVDIIGTDKVQWSAVLNKSKSVHNYNISRYIKTLL